jgi:hypothetical protein
MFFSVAALRGRRMYIAVWLSYSEAAGQLDLTLAATKSRKSRAKQKLLPLMKNLEL